MTADRAIQLALALVVAALGAALWFAKREKAAGEESTETRFSLSSIRTELKTAIEPIVKSLETINKRHEAEDAAAVKAAEERGKRLAQFETTVETVVELDEVVEDHERRITDHDTRIGHVERKVGFTPPTGRLSTTRAK